MMQVKPVVTEEEHRHQTDAPVKESITSAEEKQIDHPDQDRSNGVQEQHDDKEAATVSEAGTPIEDDGDMKEETKTSRRNSRQQKRRSAHRGGEHHEIDVEKKFLEQMATKGNTSASDREHEAGTPAATRSQDVTRAEHPKPTKNEDHADPQPKKPNGENGPPSEAIAKTAHTKPVDEKRPDQRTRNKEKARQEAEAKKLEPEGSNQVIFGAGAKTAGDNTASMATEAGREKPKQHRGGQKGKHSKDIYREQHGLPPFKKDVPADPSGNLKGTAGTQIGIEDQSRAVNGGKNDGNGGSNGLDSGIGGQSVDVPPAKKVRGGGPRKREDFETFEEFEQYQRNRAEKSKEQAALRERAEARKPQAALEETGKADERSTDSTQPIAGPSQPKPKQEQGTQAAASSDLQSGRIPSAGGEEEEHGEPKGDERKGDKRKGDEQSSKKASRKGKKQAKKKKGR
ncbi:uncharacterized protein N0V89_010224 [Didymosphaeria variabile]|uniref:Uncharacterized protein n=1 Tax=Didymosphaeria variabile TaxID=1932322 RepID=A0A9W8XFG0_9PLEO|nr:uncharacterized protein N0V89_010224 [Didymosphaeria variabile]KAJ4348845.1 hypothetical protein N0V89_010224 [Didymosphaeria variabile]